MLPVLGLAQRHLLVGVAAGVAYGVGLWLVLAMLIVMPLMGPGPFGARTGSARPALATLGIHIITERSSGRSTSPDDRPGIAQET